MKRIIIAFILAVLCFPRFAAAQSYSAPAGEMFKQEGIASWYGPEFDGRPTASGEIFNSTLLTAAHQTLPLGTILLVTNRHNNRQVAVKVNDRGPFVASRIIDVSKAAAEQLDMLVTGTAPVLIEAIQMGYVPPSVPPPPPPPAPPVFSQPPVYSPPPAYTQPPVYSPPPAAEQPPAYPYPPAGFVPPPPPPPVPMEAQTSTYGPVTVTMYSPSQPPQPAPYATVTVAPPPQNPQPVLPTSLAGAKLIPAMDPLPGKMYKLQVGSFKIARNAVDAYVKLQKAGFNPEYERNGEFYRVVLKGIQGTEVQSVAVKLEQAGFSEAVIREE